MATVHSLSGSACLVLTLALFTDSARSQQAQGPVKAISPDQRLLAAADGKAIIVSDVATQKILIKMLGHTAKITALAISPDGKLLASGSLDKSVGLWQLATGRQVLRLRAPNAIDRVTFSQDGKTLTTRESDQTQREWDVATGKQLRQVKGK